jgi:hypothetical protein
MGIDQIWKRPDPLTLNLGPIVCGNGFQDHQPRTEIAGQHIP